ncbi:MAG: exo-alpha-sialidase [Clostridia bacterium]|nr:exo-alpha-sialidase [Clostridia bacterium]
MTTYEITIAASCAEPILRRAPSGDLICSAVIENHARFFRSTDNGVTWHDERDFIPNGCSHCSELAVFDGVITACLAVHDGRFFDWRCVMLESRDDGHSWNELPHPEFEGCAFLRSMIRTGDGMLVCAYQHYPVMPEQEARLKESPDADFTGVSVPFVETGILLTCDRFASWDRFPAMILSPEGANLYPNPTVIEYKRDCLAMLAIHDGTLWRSDSTDGGMTWDKPRDTGIHSIGKPKLLRLGDRPALLHTPEAGKIELIRSENERVPLGEGCGPDGIWEDGHLRFAACVDGGIRYFDYEL